MAKPRFTRKQLGDVRSRLVAMYTECSGQTRNDLRQLMEGSDHARPCSLDEDIVDSSADMTATLASQHSDACNRILDALARLDRGFYGQCADCDDEIPARRLEKVPEAVRCVWCQERLEQHPQESSRDSFREHLQQVRA